MPYLRTFTIERREGPPIQVDGHRTAVEGPVFVVIRYLPGDIEQHVATVQMEWFVACHVTELNPLE